MDNNIRKTREAAGISQADLAKRVNKTTHMAAGILSQIESGRSIPTLDELQIIAAELRTTPDKLYSPAALYVLYGIGNPEQPPRPKERRARTGAKAVKLQAYLPPNVMEKVDTLVDASIYNSRSEWAAALVRREVEAHDTTPLLKLLAARIGLPADVVFAAADELMARAAAYGVGVGA